MPRGRLIVFEGADRSGKTTQTRRYAQRLRDNRVTLAENVPWRFPDRCTPIGSMIDAYLTNKADLDDRTLHLLFSANRWEKAADIRDALSRGETVILDRYAYSGVAYSVAKGLPLDWCRAPDAGLPAPDVVIYLDLPPEAARRRGDYGAERYENVAMQTAVARVFQKLRTDAWRIVDANADEDTVFCRVMSAVEDVLEKGPPLSGEGEVSELW